MTLNALGWLSGRITSARQIKAGRQVKEARTEVIRAEQKRVASRPPPKIEPVVHKVEKSERHEKERQAALFERPTAKELPALSLLDDAPARASAIPPNTLEAMSRLVELKLRVSTSRPRSSKCIPGPVITKV